MNCAACGHANPEGAKFCLECGSPFAARCASCGTELPPAAKFCFECGARTAAAAAGPTPAPRDGGARKVVTILFADLAGSTALQERLDAESTSLFMERYYAAMRAAVEAHRGTVVKLLGDGVMVAFGVPSVAEDDAVRAVRAGVAMQQAFRALAADALTATADIGLRVAVNTGEVVVNADHSDVVGDPVNVAARLQQEAGDGEVVLGEATQRLVAAVVTLELLGSVTLKGRSEAVKAYRVVSLERPQGAAAAAFVGRDEELARLSAVYERAVARPESALLVLVGSPGLGKSRLIDEFARRQAGASTVIMAHCDAAGGATFAPLVHAVRALLAVEDGSGPEAVRAALETALPGDEERGRIAAGIGAMLAGSPASPEETFFVVRRFLAGVARARPVLLVIDDLHWAEPLLLDLVEHLVQWGAGVPLLVLVGARPELRAVRASLVTPGGLVADVVTLAGLDAGAAMRLAANVIGAADLPAAVAAKVLATSEGNPLFVGELVRMLVQEGALTKEGERWTIGAGLAALEMPPTIHALLAARIERLRPDERGVLERAAVVGRHFSRGAVAALLPRDAGDLDPRLESLKRSELIEADTGWFLGEPALRFHHVLIRDAAYRRLLKGTRAELHARLADWIEAQVGDAAEHDESIGRHLEQAYQHRRELGPLDAPGRRFGERAAQRLAAAGRRALAGDDLPLAAGLLGRALACLDDADPSRADLALDWCEALLAAGDVAGAALAIDELARHAAPIEAAGGASSAPVEPGLHVARPEAATERRPPGAEAPSGDAVRRRRLRAWQTCFIGQRTALTAPQGLQATADAVAAAAAEFATLGDAAGEAKAHQVHAQALARLGRVGACEVALDRALAAARQAGDRRRANAVLAGAPLAALWGPSPVTRASGRCLDVVRVLRITQGAPAVEAVALSCQGVLEVLRGRADAARRMVAAARRMVEELGIAHRLHETDAFAGRIAAMEGNTAAAEPLLRGAYDGLRDLGLGIDAARAGALLARVLLAQDRAAEAEALSHESEALAGDDLQAAIAWRGVRAEALVRRGEPAAAIELAQAAVAIAAATDALLDHADARLALAAVLRAAGRGAEADAEQQRAVELWEAKGATLLAERVRRGGPALGEPRPPVPPPAALVIADREYAAPAPAEAPGGVAPSPRAAGNVATAMAERLERAFAASDEPALAALWSDALVVVDHPTGVSYGRDGHLDSLRRLRQAREPRLHVAPLAALGEHLALCRRTVSARGTAGGRVDVADWDRVESVLFETADDGVCRRVEIFAGDRLGDAIACLYARYAEQLSDETERQRATVTARAIAYILTNTARADETQLFSPSYEDVDHRNVGYGTLSTGEASQLVDTERALADELRYRVDDILALRPDGLVRISTTTGIWRDGGGAFERTVCRLSIFGPDGRAARQETFDADRRADALARFDQATGARPPVMRRVRENAATATIARVDQIVVVRDAEALAGWLSEDLEFVHHPTATTYGRREMLTTWRSLFRAKRLDWRTETLASLGDALALERHVIGAEGFVEAHLAPAGSIELEEICLWEVDAHGRCAHLELFAADQLAAAICRLYERRAAQLAEGPARVRAHGAARALNDQYFHLLTRDRLGHPFTADIEWVDHRVAGVGRLHGETAVLGAVSAFLDLVEDATWRADDVLGCTADVLLTRSTNLGTDRASGGAFERTILSLVTFHVGGRIGRWETWDGDREAEARARFAALTEGETNPPTSAFANAASASLELEMRYWAGRDWEGLQSLVSPAIRFHDRRRLFRVEVGFDEFTAQQRLLFEQPRGRWIEPMIATRGERLSLHRVTFEAEVGGGGGPLEIEHHFVVVEVDADGRWTGLVLFDADDEAAAFAELDARYDVDEGAAYPAHGAVMRAFTTAVVSRDWEPVLALCAPTLIEYDHRALAVLGTTHNAEAWVRNFRTLTELAPDTVYRVDHLRSAVHGFCSVGTWFGTRDGGRYEIALIAVLEIDDRGRLTRADIYDPDQRDGALARFAELGGRAAADPLPPAFANDATRFVDRYARTWAGRDRHAVADLYAPNCHFDDRRPLLRMELPRETNLEQIRVLFEVPNGRWTMTSIATRGERLTLSRLFFEGDAAEGGGALEIDHLSVVETDGASRLAAVVLFEPDALDAAHAELDRRYANGEGDMAGWRALRAVHGAVERRDWDASTAAFAPRFAVTDRRRLGWGLTLSSAEMFTQSQRSLAELAPDFRYRFDHVRASDRGYLTQLAQVGTRDGGVFESPFVYVATLDAAGRPERFDLWDVDGAGEAVACYRALAAPPAADGARSRRGEGFANAASASAEAVARCLIAHDWAGFRAQLADDFHVSDRRRVVQLELDRDRYVAFTREVADGRTVRNRWELVATRGDRLAVTRAFYEFAGGDVGPSEIAFLLLQEVDERGRVIAYVRWDVDDLDAAYAELGARWLAGEGAEDRAAAWSERLAAIRDQPDPGSAGEPLFAPHFVAHDHRLVSWGTLQGGREFLETLRLLSEMAPDVRFRTDHVRTCPHGIVSGGAWVGTHDGGVFESESLSTIELDADGRALRLDLWDPNHLDEALLRFEEIAARRVADTASAIAGGHPATVMLDRWRLSTPGVDADWEALRASLAPGLVFEDRQGFARLAGDRELMIASLRERMASGARAAYRVEGTAGTRVAISRMLWSGGPADGRFEIEYLGVTEVDAAGLVAATILFAADDGRAARREAWARWAAIEPAMAATVTVVGEADDAFNAHDRDRLRGLFADDLAVDDHRRTGIGRIEGADAYADRLAVLWDLSPDTRVELGGFWLASDARGGLFSMYRTGNVAGGGPFESDYLMLIRHARGCLSHLELYELDQRDAALARWSALASVEQPEPTPAIARPNAASAAMDRWQAAFAAGDWEAVRALGAPGMTIEDRRRHAQISFDADTGIADWRIAHDAGVRPQRRLVGTAGDRIAVEHLLWAGGPPDGRWEIDHLWLFEVDADGLFVVGVAFDADDRRAAQREAWARWAASDASVATMTAALGEAIDAWNAEDAERLHACFADDLVVDDRRRTGTGRSEGREAYMRSVEALWQLAPGSRFEAGWHWLAIAAQSGVYPARRFGTLPDGGAFESDFLIVSQVGRGHTTRLEFFEIDAVDAALGRFRELTRHPAAGARPDLLRIPPNAATRMLDEIGARWAEPAALRALVSDDFSFEDHGRHAQVRGGVDQMVRGIQFLLTEARAQLEARVVATAGERLVLRHFHWRERAGDPRFEIERWNVNEVDDAGRLRAVILYDLEQRAEAFADLNERYLRSTYPHLVPSFRNRRTVGRDLARIRALLPDDFFFRDHRRTGLGLLESADAYVSSLAALFELSPDALVGQSLYFLAEADHGTLSIAQSVGTLADGGAFESVYAMIILYGHDRMIGCELFELDDLDAAKARFAALAPRRVVAPRPEPLRIPPNAAAETGDRQFALTAAGDWDAVRALHAPSLVFDDRRPGLRTTTDGDGYRAGLRWGNAGRDLQLVRTLLATAGDRLALHLNRFTRPGEIFEIETLAINEVDADGRLLAVVLFAPEDRAAASDELFERYAALGADGAPPAALELMRAWQAHDLARVRALLPDDFYLDDRRRTGVGRLEGADTYLTSLAAIWELSPDLRTDALYVVANALYGRLYVARWSGTNTEGGEFDAVYVCLGLSRGGRPLGLEIFELDELDAARARFETLRSGLSDSGRPPFPT